MKAGKLVQLDENVYYLGNGINLGIIRTSDEECAVVDTGLDQDAAQRLLAAADSLKLKITRIINTHSHADHFGGNAYLVKKTGAKVYAPAFESVIMMHPFIEPFFLFGANPIPELTERYVMGRRSHVDTALTDGYLEMQERNLQVVPLPGHSPNQIGVVAEAVCFLGDALFSDEAWRKHVVVYVADVGKTLESLERLRTVGAREFVPSHAEPTSEIAALIDLNVSRIQEIADTILHLIAQPVTVDEALKAVADRFGLAITNPQQYYLTLSAIKAYLSYLAEKELARYFMDENRLFWQATE